MLNAQRAEVKKNRDLCMERLALEISEKKKKLEKINNILNEPMISVEAFNSLANQVATLRKNIQDMELKLKSQSNKPDDKLSIYKQQAALISKKKEKSLEDLKKSEEIKNKYEGDVNKMDANLKKVKGNDYNRGDFEKYANTLREKTTKYKKMLSELNEIKSELTNLQRTIEVLKNKKESYEKILKIVESQKGITGFSDVKDKLEEISEQKGKIDEQKGKTLEELAKLNVKIESQFKAKKAQLQPLIKELKELRNSYEETEKNFKEKKQKFDQITSSIENENTLLDQDVKKLKDDVYKTDTKITLFKYQNEVFDLKIKRLDGENDSQNSSEIIDKNFKTYRDFMKANVKSI